MKSGHRGQGLESMPHLAWLDASHNAIEDVQPLAMLFQLKELHLGSNNIVNLEGLEGLKDLSLLELHDNQVSLAHHGPRIYSFTTMKRPSLTAVVRVSVRSWPMSLRSVSP